MQLKMCMHKSIRGVMSLNVIFMYFNVFWLNRPWLTLFWSETLSTSVLED